MHLYFLGDLNLNQPPSYPTSKIGKDWSAVEKDIKEQEAREKPEGEDAINKLFQEIYGKGSDEVKRAMNKSYVRSMHHKITKYVIFAILC